jgi:hypothetical protein
MEAGVKYRTIASICAVIATISALGRWQIGAVGAVPPPKANPATSTPAIEIVPAPKLPAPTFLEFQTESLPTDGGLDLADNGAILLTTIRINTLERRYQYLSPTTKPLDVRVVDPTERYSLSQNGRLIKFRTSQLPLGTPRRTPFRLSLSDLVFRNSNILASARRFFADGATLSSDFADKNSVSVRILKDSKPIRTLYSSREQVGIAEVDDAETAWIWESRLAGKVTSYRIFKADRIKTQPIPFPPTKGTPKLITTTKGRTVFSVRVTEPNYQIKVYELVGGAWNELAPPPGFKSMIIQRITDDGLMFGGLQSHETNFVPAVWKDGVAYDLRRHPDWPLGGDRSYVQAVNRRGDLVIGSLAGGTASDESCTMLRRLVSK